MNLEKKKHTEHTEMAAPEYKAAYANVQPAESEQMEIDLVDLCHVMLDKLPYIILCFLIGAVLLNAYAYFFIHPTYESVSKIYVVSSSDDSVVDLSDLNMGTSLTKDYEELILSYPLLDQVISNLGLGIEYDDLARMITLTNPSNTRVLRIAVETTDPYLSCDIANELAEISAEYLPETMGTIAPNIAQQAQPAKQKSGPSYLKYTMIGAMLGTLLCCAIIILQYMLDDTIHTAEDMEKYFGLVPLTSIPDSELFGDENEDRRKSRKRANPK